MQFENVEDFYPLVPAQQGILFHSLHDRTPVYQGSLAFTFFEGVDENAFEAAWRCLVERHAVLRTFFVWDGLKDPAQVVRRSVSLPLERHDWRLFDVEEQSRHFKLLLKAEHAKGFDLSKAPIMRLHLIRLSELRYHFLWSHHHILIDGWSVPLLLDELMTLYAAGPGKVSSLPVRPPYRDYVAWLAKQNHADAEAYWRDLFRGFSLPIALGSYLPQGSSSPGSSNEQEIHLDPSLFDSLREVARAQRITLNTLVQAAWAIVLHRLSGVDDLVYGVTTSGRPPELEGAEQMIGLFINTLPMRVKVQDGMPLGALFQAIQDQQAATRQFEYSRLVDVQSWSGASRSLALFDSIFVFENYPPSAIDSNGAASVKAGDLTFDQSTNYAITLAVALGKTLTLRCLHDPQRVSSYGAFVLLGCLRHALQSIVANVGQFAGGIEVFPLHERHASSWTQPVETIPQLFAAQVSRSPSRVAVASDDETLLFSELDECSDGLAHHMRSLGVGPEEIVAVCLDRTPQLAVVLLSILKAGAAYLPIDPGLPQSRVDYMLRDSSVGFAVTASAHVEKIKAPTVINLDHKSWHIEHQRPARPEAYLDSANLAYVIYTSGSTGNPKGVMVSHSSLINLVRNQIRAFEITDQSRILQFASTSFDASVSEIFCSLLSGASLYFPNANVQRGGEELFDTIAEREISVVTLPPSLLTTLPYRDMPLLRTLVVAGESCPASVVSRWSEGRRFLNAYGPTEATVCSTISEPLHSNHAVDIGQPIGNAAAYILDACQRILPDGVPGELFVAGALLARGYRNKPGLTAERFLPDPFSSQPGARMYRTGDRARQKDGGEIEYLGRIDFQVKLRGFRIELGEIESRLEAASSVSRACATVREDRPGDRRLVAYVTPVSPGNRPEPVELLRSLRGELPEYMVPSVISVLDAFPLNTSGKVDRSALPAPEIQDSSSSISFVAPRNETERIIASIWLDVLNLKAVGVHDNFFDLGGHSLLLMQAHGKLKAAFPKEISVIQMFGYPTIEKLAEFYTSSEAQNPARAFINIHERIARKREALKRIAAQEVS